MSLSLSVLILLSNIYKYKRASNVHVHVSKIPTCGNQNFSNLYFKNQKFSMYLKFLMHSKILALFSRNFCFHQIFMHSNFFGIQMALTKKFVPAYSVSILNVQKDIFTILYFGIKPYNARLTI